MATETDHSVTLLGSVRGETASTTGPCSDNTTSINNPDTSPTSSESTEKQSPEADSNAGSEINAVKADSNAGSEINAVKADSNAGSEINAVKADSNAVSEMNEVKADSNAVSEVKADSNAGSEVKTDSNAGSEVKADSNVGSEVKADSNVGSEEVNAVSNACSEVNADGNAGSEVNADSSTEVKAQPDEYMYTAREEFTSELYKICVTNLPKHFGFSEFKKKLTSLSLNPVKLKCWRKRNCYVTFRDEKQKQNALTTLNGLSWKGKQLVAQSTGPAADPLIRKRKLEQERNHYNKKPREEEDSNLTPDERLKNSVMPLWNVSYEDQLKTKDENIKGFLKRLHRVYEKTCPDIKGVLQQLRLKHGGFTCHLQDIVPSPVMEGYRNKCEFTIGPGVDGKDTVGFRLGQYAKGSVAVASPDAISFVSDAMKTVVKEFQKFVDSGGYRSFNPVSHTGHWRQLAIRTSRLGQVMVMADFHPQQLQEEHLQEEMSRLKEYFQSGPGSHCRISSCFFRAHSEKMTGAPTSSPHRPVFGDETITEKMLDMTFRISPTAFFQVNTEGAELLYSKVAELCSYTPTTTVLDICCGTGSIGLSVAKAVDKVIGIEMCQSAVEDARFNAELNGISNVDYHCDKAENVIQRVTRSLGSSSDVVAIVDPPRSGLPTSVMTSIRNCPKINRLVYISCKVTGAMANFTDLMMPVSKRLRGERFFPVTAVPVDMFPCTEHCELVVLFERWRPEKTSTTASA